MPAQTILITGATDGIGLALARRYLQRDDRLVLVGRQPLRDLHDPLFTKDTYCQADLSQSDAAARILRFLQEHDLDALDVLVNNAGTSYYGPLEEQPAENVREVVAVNLRAPIALTHTLLPHLRRASGQIVFVSSVVTAMPAPKYPVYAATKAAIDGFVRNLRIELADEPVTVQLVHPGGTKTGLHAKIGAPRSERFPTADEVAADIVEVIDKGTPTAAIGVENKVMRIAGRYLAWFVDGAMRLGKRFL